MATSLQDLGSSRRKTLTPTLEAGQPTSTPIESDCDDSDDGILVMSGMDRMEEDRSDEVQMLFRDERFDQPGRKLQRKGSRWISVLGFSIPLNLALLLLVPMSLMVVYWISRAISTDHPTLLTISNGTHLFHPTVLLISLDGFRPTYLTSHPDLTKNLHRFSTSPKGLRAESMRPCFPTQTFPNHWSIMTGLYPESHGIIFNEFYDPQMDKTFVYTKKEASWESEWWLGEPMWSVAERGGRSSANIMWAGPPVTQNGIAPSLFIPFRKMPPMEKLSQILDWLDLPIQDRPQLITAYIPNIDHAGHKGGPDSQLVEDALSLIDEFVGGVIDRLEERNLTDIVNAIIVSDHGMTSTANERLIYLDDVLGEEGFGNIEHRDGWPSNGLRFKEGSPADEYLDVLLKAADESKGSFSVYTHETMPARWHFNNSQRIPPILMVPHIGWSITDHHEHEVINKGEYSPKGNHGYDNIEPDMQAIFMAHGPVAQAMKSLRKGEDNTTRQGWISTEPPVFQSFANLEVYSLVMRLMGLEHLEPAHNGTIGFWDRYLG